MINDRFIEKFKSKSDENLEQIAGDSESFTLAARYSAIILLKERNNNSSLISQVEKEYENHIIIDEKEKSDLIQKEKRLIDQIKQIPIKKKRKYYVNNGIRLNIRRLNTNTFQVRIENDYQLNLAPLIICKVKGESTYSTIPFFNIKSLLIFGIGGSTFLTALSLLGYFKKDILFLTTPIIISIGLQLFLMPFFYFLILRLFRKKFKHWRQSPYKE